MTQPAQGIVGFPKVALRGCGGDFTGLFVKGLCWNAAPNLAESKALSAVDLIRPFLTLDTITALSLAKCA